MKAALGWSLVVLSASANLSSAGVALTAGPGGGPTVSSGFRSVSIHLAPGVPLNNVGTSIAYAEKYSSNASIGYRGIRWKFGGVQQELGGLTNANVQSQSQVYAINDAGLVVGWARKAGTNSDRAVRYNAADVQTATELGSLTASTTGIVDSEAWAINQSGVAVGYSETYQGNVQKGTRAVVWGANNTTPQELGSLSMRSDGLTYSHASVINNSGTVAGGGSRWGVNDVDLGFRPVRWAAGSGTAFELDSLSTRSDGYAYGGVNAINAAGIVVGYSRRFGGMNNLGDRPVRWNTGGTAVTELGILGTDVNGAADGFARDINSDGTTVGWVQKHNAQGLPLGFRAVRWDANSTAAIELGGLGANAAGISSVLATSINEMGTIAGAAEAYNGATALGHHATIWLPGSTQALDLNTLLPANTNWTLSQAYQVSDTGFVMGNGQYDADGPGGATSYLKTWSMLVPQAGTYGRGDANFDLKIDFDDLLLLAQHYGQANASLNVRVGDLNLDGNVNFDDLLSLAQHYGANAAVDAHLLGASFATEWALARSLVPEPASLISGAALLAALRRRR